MIANTNLVEQQSSYLSKEKFSPYIVEVQEEGQSGELLLSGFDSIVRTATSPLDSPISHEILEKYKKEVLLAVWDKFSTQLQMTEQLYERRLFETRRLFIGINPSICNGAPIIMGTRISVVNIIEKTKLGWSVDRLLEEYPHLDKKQIIASIEYYDSHKQEIEQLIAEEN